jgi:hypothetical protein
LGLFNLFKIKKREEIENIGIVDDANNISNSLLRALLRNESIIKGQAVSLPIVSSSIDKVSSVIAMLPMIFLFYHRK